MGWRLLTCVMLAPDIQPSSTGLAVSGDLAYDSGDYDENADGARDPRKDSDPRQLP